MLDPRPLLVDSNFPEIRRTVLQTLQVNLGYLCNLSCVHCHVNAGPRRKELMGHDTIEIVLDFIRKQGIELLDITGGSPEMNPHFKYLVRQARSQGVEVMDRCNPTILVEPGYEDYAEFLADQKVIVTASLPCYSEQNVVRQRGRGVFEESITALKKLNALGYGEDGSGLVLNLAYNPVGPVLPPPQVELEQDYRRELHAAHGIIFNELFVLTNMPIARFGSQLISKGGFDDYMDLLRNSYQPSNLSSVMCRTLLSVDWQGYVYDCDFNQMLGLPLIASDRPSRHLRDLLDRDLNNSLIAVGGHCFGCTAGQGSSCGGALG